MTVGEGIAYGLSFGTFWIGLLSFVYGMVKMKKTPTERHPTGKCREKFLNMADIVKKAGKSISDLFKDLREENSERMKLEGRIGIAETQIKNHDQGMERIESMYRDTSKSIDDIKKILMMRREEYDKGK